jgi:hypothetical protein
MLFGNAPSDAAHKIAFQAKLTVRRLSICFTTWANEKKLARTATKHLFLSQRIN